MKKMITRWQAYVYTGFVVILPAVLAIAICVWIYGTVSGFTDQMFFFLKWIPKDSPTLGYFYVDPEKEPLELLWWWRALSIIVALVIVGLVGRMTRYYIGKKLIGLMDLIMLRVPLLNRIYSAVKQVNEAFTSKKQSSFKQVVLVEFPGNGLHSIGFLTGDNHDEINSRLDKKVVSVFVSTTPNPTTGFLVFLERSKVHNLSMSVADGIKYIISLGAVSPAYLDKSAADALLANDAEAAAEAPTDEDVKKDEEPTSDKPSVEAKD